MASVRQFKIEVNYTGGPDAEIYWHDDGTVEFVTLPGQVTPGLMSARTSLLETLIDFCKTQKVDAVIITREP